MCKWFCKPHVLIKMKVATHVTSYISMYLESTYSQGFIRFSYMSYPKQQKCDLNKITSDIYVLFVTKDMSNGTKVNRNVERVQQR